MKVVSIDYHSVNCLSGIATFNRNLEVFFNGNIKFITVYSKEKAHNIEEQCFGIPYTFPYKLINYISRYRLYPYFVSKEINQYQDSFLVFNSPSLLRFVNKNNNKIALIQHQDFSIMYKNKSGFGRDDKFIDYVFNLIDYFICLSPCDEEKIKSYIPHKFHSKLRVIPHSTKIKQGVSRKKCRKKLLMLGRLDNNQKRFDLVIKSMKNLPEWELSIYGDGKDKEYIRKTISKMNASNVHLKEFTNDIKSVLDSHDIHVMSSDFEGYPITNIEAITRGMPIIVRNTFSSASDIIDGNGVLLAKDWNENDFVSAVKHVEKEFEKFSIKSLDISKRFTLDRVSQLWKNLVEES